MGGEEARAAFLAEGQPVALPWGLLISGATLTTQQRASAADRFGACCEGDRVLRRAATASAEWDLHPQLDSPPNVLWSAPNGLLVVADRQHQLHVLGPEPGRHRLTAAHVGEVNGLCWSADSRYLAIQTMAGLRIVDRAGGTVLQRGGAHGVLAGAGPSEFVLLGIGGIERWHAAIATQRCELVPYRGGRPSLVGSCGGREAQLLGMTFFLAMDVAAVGDAWLCGGGVVAGRRVGCVRITADGEVSVVPPRKIPGEFRRMQVGEIVTCGGGALAVASWFTPVDRHDQTMMFSNVHGALRAFAADGMPRGELGLPGGVHWLRKIPEREALLVGIVGSFDGLLVEVDVATMTASHPLTGPVDDNRFTWCELPIGEHAIAGGLVTAWWLDRRTWVRTPVTWPDGVGRPNCSALAPDREHLALANGCDVAIVKVVVEGGGG